MSITFLRKTYHFIEKRIYVIGVKYAPFKNIISYLEQLKIFECRRITENICHPNSTHKTVSLQTTET